MTPEGIPEGSAGGVKVLAGEDSTITENGAPSEEGMKVEDDL